MKNLFLISTICIGLISSHPASAYNNNKQAEKKHEEHHDEHGHEEEKEKEAPTRFGPGKAIEAFDKEQGFRLSEKAAKSLNVSFQKITGPGPWKISKSAIVHLKQSDAVYRRYDGWISMVLVKVVAQDGDSVTIKSPDLEAGDDIGISGVSFLRMTDADLNAGTVDNCAH